MLKILWFTDRKKLNDEYKKWAKQNSAADSSFNVITFLEAKKLLNVQKVKKYLKKQGGIFSF